jgi:hypothetical protein
MEGGGPTAMEIPFRKQYRISIQLPCDLAFTVTANTRAEALQIFRSGELEPPELIQWLFVGPTADDIADVHEVGTEE